MTEDPKLPKKQQRRSSSKINIDDTVVRDSLDRARKSFDRSFDKIRAKGPSISDEALSQLIVRKKYNPHNTLSNLWLGSTFKLVFYRFRPWAFSVLHAVFLFLWTRERCPDGEVTCDDPIFPFRESFADFGLGLPEMGPVITMCLFVLTFYCNTCITLYPDSCKRLLESGHHRRRKSSPPQCKARCTCSACARRACSKPVVGLLVNLLFMPLPSSFSFPL